MKRQLKLIISLVVRAWDILHDAFCRLLGKPLPPRCMVLYYHAVPAQFRELFARQLDTLQRLARPVSSDPTMPLEPGSRYVCVTFDDGFVSVMENAAPELAKRKIPWTMFVPSGCLGKKPDWLRNGHPAARQDRLMTADELRALAQDRLVSIGSHTVAHANLLECGPNRVAMELTQSKTQLERVLGRPIDFFSYPFGARSATVDQKASEAGYRRIFSSDPAWAFQSPSQFLCGRVSVDPDISVLEFRLKILGAYRWQSWLRSMTTDP